MPFVRDVHEQFLNGSMLIGQADSLPDETVRVLRNARLDRKLPAVSSRPGSVALTASAIAAATVRSLHKLFGTATDYAYAHVGSALYRLSSTWTGAASIATPGTQPVSSADMVDGNDNPYKYFVNGTVIGKDDGTSLTNFGITAPTQAPSAAALATDLSTTIDAMDNAASWTGSGVAAGPADETNIKVEGTGSVTISIVASTIGSIGQGGLALNLDTLSGGNTDVKDDDYIHLWVRVDRPDFIDYMQIDFDLDTTTLANAFRDNFYSIRLSSLVWLNQGRDQWTQVQVPKSQFQRFGTSTSVDWSTVKSVRLSFLTNELGTAVIYVDDFKLRGGVDITGDVDYTAVYRNSSTGGISNPPLNSDDNVLFTTTLKGVKRQRTSITISNIISGAPAHPGDAQIDGIDIYRRIDGGQWLYIDNIADTATSPYTDAILVQDSLLQPRLLEIDNNLPPAGDIIFGPGPFNRLFMIQGQNRVYFSKAWERTYNRVENWPTDWFMVVGEGSYRAMVGMATDTDVFVFTEAQTYQVVGAGADTFLPVPVPNSRGTVSQHALTSGDGRIFFVSSDGVYEQVGQLQRRLTDGIAPFFDGQTVQGQSGWNTTTSVLETVRLEWHADPFAPMLVMLYPEAGSATANKELVLKKHPVTGQYTVISFDSRANTLQSLYEDHQSHALIAGDDAGNVYQIEVHSANDDDGSAIAFDVITKAYHQGTPLRDKHYQDVLIEGQTNGTLMTVTALFDKNTVTESLSTTVGGSSIVQDFHLPIADPLADRHDIGLRIQANTTTEIDLFRLGWLVEVQPEWLRFWDSGILDMGRISQLREIWLDIQSKGVVTITPYFDGSATADVLFNATTARQMIRRDVTAGRKGTLFRMEVSSPYEFRIYGVWLRKKALQSTVGYESLPVGQGI